jgi:hypothetical protein
MEDAYFYNAVMEETEDGDDMLTELEHEQFMLKAEVIAARALPGDKAKRIEKMIETVLAHAKKEEAILLPHAEKVLTAERLEEIGQEMEPESAVANAPTT